MRCDYVLDAIGIQLGGVMGTVPWCDVCGARGGVPGCEGYGAGVRMVQCVRPGSVRAVPLVPYHRTRRRLCTIAPLALYTTVPPVPYHRTPRTVPKKHNQFCKKRNQFCQKHNQICKIGCVFWVRCGVRYEGYAGTVRGVRWYGAGGTVVRCEDAVVQSTGTVERHEGESETE